MLLKFTVIDKRMALFCTNSLKEAFLTRFKTVSDVHLQYILL